MLETIGMVMFACGVVAVTCLALVIAIKLLGFAWSVFISIFKSGYR